MRLDHGAGLVKHADDCAMRARIAFTIIDGVLDFVKPQPAIRQSLANEIKTVSVFAWTNFPKNAWRAWPVGWNPRNSLHHGYVMRFDGEGYAVCETHPVMKMEVIQ